MGSTVTIGGPIGYDSARNAANATLGAALGLGIVFWMDGRSYFNETGGTACDDIGVSNVSPYGTGTVDHFGAVGDFNGASGTNSTAMINRALTWWAAVSARHLHFPSGWYYYAGTTSLDLGARKWNTISCDGQIQFAGGTDLISWTITNHENADIQLRLRNGGTLGDFTDSLQVGGSTALQIHTTRWCRVDIEAMNYAGRVVHFTAGGTDATTRCRMIDATIKTGNRALSGDDALCGQPFFADSGTCDQTGAFGKVNWRGEGCQYGPVFERLNDVDIGHIEAGKFVASPLEFRGCVVVMANVLYIGATDLAAGANSESVRMIPTAGGRLCGDFHIKTLRTSQAQLLGRRAWKT